MTKKTKVRLIAGAAILAAIFLLGAILGPADYEYCQHENTRDEYCTAHHVTPFVALEIGSFLDDHNGTVAALAGLAVALFTFTLWRVTEKLWSAGEAQHATSNRAFVFIREMVVTFDRPEMPPPGSAKRQIMDVMGAGDLPISTWRLGPVWENSGTTQARRLLLNFAVQSFFGPMPRVFDFAYQALAEPSFVGPKATIRGSGVLLGTDLLKQLAEHGSNNLYVWGEAEYDDVFDGSPRHRTEFCYRVEHAGTDSNGFPILIFPMHNRYNGADGECSRAPKPYQQPAV